MAWQSLSQTLASKPLVLAGPVLRKTTPESVAVWLALCKPAKVTLKILDSAGTPVFIGDRHTVAVGTNLHLVVVTARSTSNAPRLAEGVIYRYDLGFDGDDGVHQELAAATSNVPLTYGSFDKPSFCLPTTDINKLRLLQGSCRIPHGNGRDALALVHRHLQETAADVTRRPQQLLLTGDQIYADDVAPGMLLMLSDAANVLLGWKEVLPVDADSGGPAPGDKLPPFIRRKVLERAGFTSEDLDAHLLSLGEYLCMYLFVWSDVLWSPSSLPIFTDLTAAAHTSISDPIAFGKWLADRVRAKDDSRMTKHNEKLTMFRDAVPDVRRALANIPCYMMFDDHEVTDDWNMTREICKDLYGRALGLRLVQNGLAAYVLCQHWGNAPEQFDRFSGSGPELPGQALLRLLNGTSADAYAQNSAAIRTLLGVQEDAALANRPAKALFHDAGSLLYNYTIEGPGHQVIFTDTRTWRAFPFDSDAGGELLPREQIRAQIVETPPTGERVLLVVLATNAPPVQPIRTATRFDFISNTFAHHPDVYEAWELPSAAFDRLIAQLTDKLPLVSGRRTGSAILLSGDVHISFASRLVYRATARFEDGEPKPATAVVVQLSASSFRKQTDSTLGLHREGYEYAPNLVGRLLIPKHEAEGYVGWNTLVDSQRAVGQLGLARPTFVPLVTLQLDQPTVKIVPDGLFLGVAIDPAALPDYSYRLDYLTADGVNPPPPSIPELPAGNSAEQKQQAAAVVRQVSESYRRYNNESTAPRKIVGVNNMGQLTFEWDLQLRRGRKVHHTLLWHNDAGEMQRTNYPVSLDPEDVQFPEIKPRLVS